MRGLRIGWLTWAGAVTAMLLALVLRATAQEVGTIAAVEGVAEIERGGARAPAENGAMIALGDQLWTGRPGRLRVVFQDESLLTLDDDSHVSVDEHVFDPGATGKTRSLLGLLQGKVAAVVSDYYHQPGTRYEIKTPNAVAGVRGTEFSVRYDANADVTDVLSINGVVSVHSAVDPSAPGILITANEATSVVAAEPPSQPRRLDDLLIRQEQREIQFMGTGSLESVSSAHPVVSGANVPQPDRAPAVVTTAGLNGSAAARGPVPQMQDASSLLGAPPAVVKTTTGNLGIDVGRPHP
jgi:hypothetical protein